MHNKAAVIIGLLFFVAIATLPFWYRALSSSPTLAPKLEPSPGGEKSCVESTRYMREHHIELLSKWRDSVVRDGIRTYRAGDGKEYIASLTGTCLRCHSNKQNFCDRCHDYIKVSPRCWDCHVVPKGKI
jgi:hypothetical protein